MAQVHNPAQTKRWDLITTKRLMIGHLYRVHQSHIDALNDREHMRYSDQRHGHHDESNQRLFLESQCPNFWVLDLVRKKDHRSVGTMTVTLDWNNSVANLGLLIIPEVTRRGYGLEAWNAVIDHLFEIGVYKIEAGTPLPNAGMLEIFSQSGMKVEGYRSDAFLLDNGVRTDIVLAGRMKGWGL